MSCLIETFDDYVLSFIFSFLDSRNLLPLFETSKLTYNLLKKLVFLDRIQIKIPYTHSIVEYCSDDLSYFKWVEKHKFYSKKIPKFAGRYGNFKLLKYLIKNNYKVNYSDTFYELCQNNNMKILKYLSKHTLDNDLTKLNESVFRAAGESGNIDIVKFLYKNDCPFDCTALYGACYSGNLKVVKWMVYNCFPFGRYIYHHAASEGHINILNYLYELTKNDLSYPWWDESVCTSAAENGQFETLKWLRSKQCPWNILTLYSTLETYPNSLEMFKWAYENNCPKDDNITELYNSLRN